LQSVCPGDVLMSLPETGVVRIGGGVQQEGEVLVATKAGVVQQAKGGKLWVEARQKRCVVLVLVLVLLFLGAHHNHVTALSIASMRGWQAALPAQMLMPKAAPRSSQPRCRSELSLAV
jgi:hypothetical protein